MNEKKVFITSDTHFGHGRIIQYENRPFNSIQEMDNELIKRWNSKVTNKDTVIHLGDFCFGNKDATTNIVSKLNGKKILIMGNHDRTHGIKWFIDCGFDEVYKYPILYKEFFILSHEPITYLKQPFVNLFGHCVDEQTEILTKDGWKKHNEISESDIVLNLNLQKNIIEENRINKIIHKIYTGDKYYFKSTHNDICVTDKHNILTLKHNKKDFIMMTADKFFKRSEKFLLNAAQKEQKGISLSDDMLRLLVHITADGSVHYIEKRNNIIHIRFHFRKSRKINTIINLLNKLKINYKINKCKNKKDYNIYFILPKELQQYKLKPLDSKLLQANYHQCEIIIETYSISDGHKYKNFIQVYTSKKEEADLLQKICILNNKRATIFTRNINNRISYIIYISKNTITEVDRHNKKYYYKEYTFNEHFWCVNTDNGTIITRRNGKVSIIGNCHSSPNYPTFTRNSACVCVERWNYTPINFNTILLNLERLQRQMEATLNKFEPIEVQEEK